MWANSAHTVLMPHSISSSGYPGSCHAACDCEADTVTAYRAYSRLHTSPSGEMFNAEGVAHDARASALIGYFLIPAAELLQRGIMKPRGGVLAAFGNQNAGKKKSTRITFEEGSWVHTHYVHICQVCYTRTPAPPVDEVVCDSRICRTNTLA